MSIFSFQPSFLNVDRHWKSQVGHGLIALTLGLAGDIFGLWHGRAAVTAALLAYFGRERVAHRDYRREARAGEITPQELRKGLWDSKLDVAWPALAWLVVWTIPWAREAWPWWIGGVLLLVTVGRATDPGGWFRGMR